MLKILRKEWKIIENELDKINGKQHTIRFRTSLRRHKTIPFIDILEESLLELDYEIMKILK